MTESEATQAGKGGRELLMMLYDSVKEAEDCLCLLQTSFIYHSSEHLTECRKKARDFVKRMPALTKRAAELCEEDANLGPYISVPDHVLAIGENIERLCRNLERKLREEILFSSRAIEEVTFLFQRLGELLKPTAELILAPNKIVANYIAKSEDEITKKAEECATFHEERLIDGVCQPTAAPIFLTILDAIKNIARHSGQIATKLGRRAASND